MSATASSRIGATSSVAFGVSWNDSKKGRAAAGLLAALTALWLVAAAVPRAGGEIAALRQASVIVRLFPGAGTGPATAVHSLGGSVTTRIPLIHALVADVPVSDVALLRGVPGVSSVTRNRPIHFVDQSFNQNTYPGSTLNTAKIIGAQDMWRDGYTGAGVDVDLIDSGVSPVNGLPVPGNVVNGPDLSFDQGQ